MTQCPIIIIPGKYLGKFNSHRIFGMMWTNVTASLATTWFFFCFVCLGGGGVFILNIQN